MHREAASAVACERGSAQNANWNDANTKFLIIRYFELLPNFKTKHWKMRKIYDTVSSEINQLESNQRFRIKFLTDQVSHRMDYLMQRYKSVVAYGGKTGRNGRYWVFYEEIYQHMHDRHFANCNSTISSDAAVLPTEPLSPASTASSVSYTVGNIRKRKKGKQSNTAAICNLLNEHEKAAQERHDAS